MSTHILLLGFLLVIGCNKAAPARFAEGCAKLCVESGEVMHSAMYNGGFGLTCSCWYMEEK